MTVPATKSDRRGTRIGQRVGILLFALVMTSFTLVCSIQIIQQAWSTESAGPAPACREGLRGLANAVQRARSLAAQTRGERAALERFRSALTPEWGTRGAMEASCKDDKKARRMLRELDQLRYAEEHAVRYEAGDLSGRRRRVQSLMQELGVLPAPSGEPTSSLTPAHLPR
jgi:hypothetical protein